MNKWEQELNRYLNEENISDLYDKNLIKEMREFEPKKTWVEEEMERLDKYWKEELWTWEQECILRNYNKKVLTWKQSSSTRKNNKENNKMDNITRLIVRENPTLCFGFSDTTQFQSPLFPMKSELANKEEIIKKQIEVIRELNKINSELYNDIKELGEDLQSQDTGIKALVQDWKELREDCAKQTKEVKKLKEEKESLIQSTIKLQAKINLMSSMNNELQEEIEELKIKYKELWFTPVLTPYTPPYIVTCTNSTLK